MGTVTYNLEAIKRIRYMRVSKKEVESWLEVHPHFKSRKLMYAASVAYTVQALGEGFTADHAQMVILVHRRLQELIPNDEVGKKLEAEYRDTEMGMKSLVEFAEEALGGRRVIERNGVKYIDPRV